MSEIDVYSRHREIERLAAEGHAYIWVVGFIITSVYVGILFRNLSIPKDIINIQHEFLQPVTLAVYYACWVAGTKFDCTTQKWVYLVDPTKRKFPLSSVAVVVMLAAVAVGLLWFKEDEMWFAIFLIGLLVVNVIAWLHILSRVLPIIKESEKMYKEEAYYLGLERLYIVTYYINGRWQWFRFLGMALIVFGLLLVSFQNGIRLAVSDLGGDIFSIPSTTVSSVLPDCIFTLFVIFAEGWIWLERAMTRLRMKVLDGVDDYYQLTPNPEKMKIIEAHWKVHDNLKWWKTVRRKIKITSPRRAKSRRNKSPKYFSTLLKIIQ